MVKFEPRMKLEIDDKSDKPFGYLAMKVAIERKADLRRPQQKLREDLLGHMMRTYPEYFSPEEREKLQKSTKQTWRIMAIMGPLYGLSIFAGRKILSTQWKARNRKLALAYFFPILFATGWLVIGSPIQTQYVIHDISLARAQTLPNDKLFAYMLPMYRDRFLSSESKYSYY